MKLHRDNISFDNIEWESPLNIVKRFQKIMDEKIKRLPHAKLDVNSRKDKANKILSLIKPYIFLEGASVLEVGIGSGVIIYEISKQLGKSGKAVGCDVIDQRMINDGYKFVKINDTTLPFKKNTFDLVISNHVIEHVGDWNAQRHHLKEIYRILKKNGLVYFAVPNRWCLVEPHFKLPFLTWIPKILRNPYIRSLGRGYTYDCKLLSHKEAITLFREIGFEYIQKTFDAIKTMNKVEREIYGIKKYILRLPIIFFKIFYPIIPTIIFILKKNSTDT